jgi:hypothetical protein
MRKLDVRNKLGQIVQRFLKVEHVTKPYDEHKEHPSRLELDLTRFVSAIEKSKPYTDEYTVGMSAMQKIVGVDHFWNIEIPGYRQTRDGPIGDFKNAKWYPQSKPIEVSNSIVFVSLRRSSGGKLSVSVLGPARMGQGLPQYWESVDFSEHELQLAKAKLDEFLVKACQTITSDDLTYPYINLLG